MCGIAGIITLNNKNRLTNSHKEKVVRMLSLLSHRGPDQIGMDLDYDYIIGNVRLIIIGNKLGKQPLKDNCNSLVFNGEIYNYKEIQHDLLTEYEIVNSDTKVLFYFLQKFKLQKLQDLNGMFSFCYITKTKIYLVRDRFGIKPLYFTHDKDALYFASEIKAFFNLIDLQIKITDVYTSLETSIGKNTIFSKVFQVEPGSYLEIDRNTKKIKKYKYYDLLNKTSKKSLTEKQSIDKLRWLVTDAINIRTTVNLDYGAYISGGIDSSIISLISKPKYLFTFLPQSKTIPSEEKYADIISSLITRTEYKKVIPNPKTFLSQFIEMIYANDGPTTTLAAYSQYLLAKEAHRHNLRIVLSGLGADEFFNGYVRHAITYLPKEYLKNRLFTKYKPMIIKAKNAGFIEKNAYFYTNLLNRNNQEIETIRILVDEIFKKNTSILSAVSMCDAFFTLPPLLHTDDHINMASGIESRSPFMDYRLIEFALTLPDDIKIRIDKKSNEIYMKYLLRQTFKDILPKSIYDRKDKIGFTSNINDLLREDLQKIVTRALKLLQKEFPNIQLFLENPKQFEKYSRWEYQILQLAITYLLFTKKYSKEKTLLFLQDAYNS